MTSTELYCEMIERNEQPPPPDVLAEWKEWLASRPAKVREVASRLVPWKVYRLKSTRQFVRVVSYGERPDGSISVRVAVLPGSSQIDSVVGHEVFGLEPDELVEVKADAPAEPQTPADRHG